MLCWHAHAAMCFDYTAVRWAILLCWARLLLLSNAVMYTAVFVPLLCWAITLGLEYHWPAAGRAVSATYCCSERYDGPGSLHQAPLLLPQAPICRNTASACFPSSTRCP
eukprot:GHUV01040588.1.p1 GENE.GHUV01040588.1~~GHUV01040588.1.p1  ORF type:complete len:109 (+),score=10.34 GHUV01040588.1:79-405(+)